MSSEADNYARALLADLGATHGSLPERAPEHPALAWARSGGMALTGHADGAPQVCPVPLASYADGALAALASLSTSSRLQKIDGARLLGERAAIAGYGRNGGISPSGTCRLLPSRDGFVALNLARDSDWELLPALFGAALAQDWEAVADAVQRDDGAEVVARGRELGLAIASWTGDAGSEGWVTLSHTTQRDRNGWRCVPLVVDLSSLWAGPLCGHLLQLAGARVIKFESLSRPDGARYGPGQFFDLVNGGKQSVAFDLRQPIGSIMLRQLLGCADIVIESARPRGLAQIGIVAEELVAERPELIWISITGHGRAEPGANWVAFGDDAGVAAGLTRLLADPIFCGDAIADPLTGLHAALVVSALWCSGIGGIASLSLSGVVAHCIRHSQVTQRDAAQKTAAEWAAILNRAGVRASAPTARRPDRPAADLGADNTAIIEEFDLRC